MKKFDVAKRTRYSVQEVKPNERSGHFAPFGDTQCIQSYLRTKYTIFCDLCKKKSAMHCKIMQEHLFVAPVAKIIARFLRPLPPRTYASRQ